MILPLAWGRNLRFGLFEVDLEERSLAKRGVPIKLQEKPFQILTILIGRPGEVISRDELKAELWQADTFVEFDDGLNTAIKKLRIALDDSSDNPVYIETVPRRGYRFLAPVERRGDSPSPGSEQVASPLSTSNLSPSEPLRPQAIWGRRRLWLAASLVAIGLVGVGLIVFWKERTVERKTIATQIGASQRQSETVSTARQRPIDPQAYDDYIQARQFWKERTAEALSKAVDHFSRAIERDPNYAEAYAGLANCYVVLPMVSSLPRENAHRKARQAAEKAIALDDSLAEAHLSVAEVRLYDDWDFPGAEREFKRALELDSNSAQGHQWYAEFLSLMSRHSEAIAEIQTAQRLDPPSMIIYHQAGQIYLAARRYDDAFEQYRRVLQIQPGFGPTYSALATLYRRQRNYPANLEAQQKANSYWNSGGASLPDLNKVAEAYHESGERGFLRAMIEFDRKHPGPIYYRAWPYALLGDREQAVYLVQKSFEKRELEILELRNDPELDSLRSDQRFQAIVKAIGFQ